MNLVLDASVVVKCLVPESDSDKSKALLVNWTQRTLEVAAPEILSAEIASALATRAARGLISDERAMGLYDDFLQLEIPLEPIAQLARGALKIAVRHRRSIYDCLYVALAIEMGWGLVTADERLFNALQGWLPEVQLLRDLV
jgi:predicted nucleic acid-binding protein